MQEERPGSAGVPLDKPQMSFALKSPGSRAVQYRDELNDCQRQLIEMKTQNRALVICPPQPLQTALLLSLDRMHCTLHTKLPAVASHPHSRPIIG